MRWNYCVLCCCCRQENATISPLPTKLGKVILVQPCRLCPNSKRHASCQTSAGALSGYAEQISWNLSRPISWLSWPSREIFHPILVYPLRPASLCPAAIWHDASFFLTVIGCSKLFPGMPEGYKSHSLATLDHIWWALIHLWWSVSFLSNMVQIYSWGTWCLLNCPQGCQRHVRVIL